MQSRWLRAFFSFGGDLVKTYLIVEVVHRGPLPNLAAAVANRAHSMQGVDGVEAWVASPGLVDQLEAEKPAAEWEAGS